MLFVRRVPRCVHLIAVLSPPIRVWQRLHIVERIETIRLVSLTSFFGIRRACSKACRASHRRGRNKEAVAVFTPPSRPPRGSARTHQRECIARGTAAPLQGPRQPGPSRVRFAGQNQAALDGRGARRGTEKARGGSGGNAFAGGRAK